MKAMIVSNQRQRTLLFYKVSRWPLILCNMTTDQTLHQTNCRLALAISIKLPDTSPTVHGILKKRTMNKKGANDVAFEKVRGA
uniref:Uncharacterized protein n=1 Tax=Glossina morsitans morsitans TaxID=37546 RepID=A0A1B0FB09_GLOMM